MQVYVAIGQYQIQGRATDGSKKTARRTLQVLKEIWGTQADCHLL